MIGKVLKWVWYNIMVAMTSTVATEKARNGLICSSFSNIDQTGFAVLFS